MMKHPVLRFLLPHVLVTVFFAIISLAYFYPVLTGKSLVQSDIVQFKGMQRQILEHRAAFDEEPYWIDNAFVGMPTYQITSRYPYDILRYIDDALRFLPRPADMLFLYLFFFYVFAQSRGFSKATSILGSLAYGFSSYYIIILMVGHNTKAMTLAYAPLIFLGLFQVLIDKKKWGFVWLTIGLALQLHANHLQMTYYTLVMAAIWTLLWGINTWRKEGVSHVFKPVGTLLVCGILALMMNAQHVLPTLEYTKFSTRGASELSINPDGSPKIASNGLSFDYITEYSYGIFETLTFVSPNIMGGSSSEGFSEESPFMKFLQTSLGTGALDYDTATNLLQQFRPYWGDQPFVAAPVYLGVALLFFSFLGLLISDRNTRIVLFSIITLSLLFSWGKNMPVLTQFFIDYLPLYDKFRSVSSAQIMLLLCAPYAAMLGVKYLTQNHGIDRKKLLNVFIVFAIFIALLFFLIGGAKGFFSFTSSVEASYALPEVLLNPLRESRITLIWDDIYRVLLLVGLISVVVIAFWRKLITAHLFVLLVTLFVFADLWQYNRAFFNENQFVSSYQFNTPFKATALDKQILLDKTRYRVFEPSLGYSSSRTAYFHRTIGGYHGAKPAVLQDVYDFYLRQQDSVVMDMLNIKYVISNAFSSGLQERTTALGAAWLVEELVHVANANEELTRLNTIDPKKQALSRTLTETTYQTAETDKITIVESRNNLLRYHVTLQHERLAVFSEMYYPNGWTVSINDTDLQQHKVNYMLRGVVIPPGKHELVFKFSPPVVQHGSLLMASGWLLFICVIGIRFRLEKIGKIA